MPAPGRFALWGPDHLVVIALISAIALAMGLGRAALRRREDRRWRRAAAAMLAGTELMSLMLAAAQGHPRVPLQLCDLAEALTIVALWTLRPGVCRLAYFWGVAGSLQAILTPDLRWGFPDYWWVKFFITHAGVVLSVTYLALTGRVTPTGRSVWVAWGLANLYAVFAGIINWRYGTNYGYLAHKPLQPSLLDSCGPWPYYIGVMELLALVSFWLLWLPFVLVRRRDDG